MFHHHATGVGNGADPGGVEVPFGEDPLDFAFPAPADDHQHALLRLGEQNFPAGIHAAFHFREHPVQLNFDPRPAPAGGLAGRAGEPGRAHILDSDHQIRHRHHFEAGLDQKLLHEGVSLLHRRPVGGAFLAQFLRSEGGPAEAVPAGGCPHVIDGIADPGRLAAPNLIVAEGAETKGIDQRVALVARVKIDIAAHRGNAHAISVMCDARDHAAQKPLCRRAN